MQVKWRNLGVAPAVRMLRSRRLSRPAGYRRLELSVTGMLCGL